MILFFGVPAWHEFVALDVTVDDLQVILAEGYQAAAQPGDSYPQYAVPADGAYADSAPSHRPPPRPPSGYAPVSTSPRSGGGGGFGSPASTTGDTAVGDAQTEKLKREVARLQGEVERLDKEVQQPPLSCITLEARRWTVESAVRPLRKNVDASASSCIASHHSHQFTVYFTPFFFLQNRGA